MNRILLTLLVSLGFMACHTSQQASTTNSLSATTKPLLPAPDTPPVVVVAPVDTAIRIIDAMTPPSDEPAISESTKNIPERMLIGKMQGRQAVFTVGEEELRTIFKELISDCSKLKDFKLQSWSERLWYLTAEGRKDNIRAHFAIELNVTPLGFQYEQVNHPWYICKENDCKDCSFVVGVKGNIEGCSCETREDRIGCNFVSGIRTNE